MKKNVITLACSSEAKETRRFRNSRKYEYIRVEASVIDFVENFGSDTGFTMHELPEDDFIIEKEFNDEKIMVISTEHKFTIIHINDSTYENALGHTLTVDWIDDKISLYHHPTPIIQNLANEICEILGVEELFDE